MLSMTKVLTHTVTKLSLEKEYEEEIGQEYRYFEFVNTLRLISRELFTKVNPENGAQRIEALLQELRDKLFFFDFSSRFLNEEIRDADFYDDENTSAMSHLATVKELFATHLALLWMAGRTHSLHKGKPLESGQVDKLNYIQKKVRSLIAHRPLLELLQITTRYDGQHREYSVDELRKILASLDSASAGPGHDQRALAEIQQLYWSVHQYFLQKATIQTVAIDDGDYLFSLHQDEMQ